jgi:hypothetical protein
VAVIAIPLTFRRAASRAVQATNGPATWTSPPHRKKSTAGKSFSEKAKTDPPPDPKIFRVENAHLCD